MPLQAADQHDPDRPPKQACQIDLGLAQAEQVEPRLLLAEKIERILIEDMGGASTRQQAEQLDRVFRLDRGDMALQDPNIGPAPPALSPRHPIWPNLEGRKYLHCESNLPST